MFYDELRAYSPKSQGAKVKNHKNARVIQISRQWSKYKSTVDNNKQTPACHEAGLAILCDYITTKTGLKVLCGGNSPGSDQNSVEGSLWQPEDGVSGGGVMM